MASKLALVLILAAYIVQGQSGDDKICGFDVNFDDWLGPSVPTDVLHIFCYSKGLCHDSDGDSNKHADLCNVVARQMERLLNETSEIRDAFRKIQSIEDVHFDCATVDASKLHVNVFQDTSLSQVVIELTSPLGCNKHCSRSQSAGFLCNLAIELLQYSVPTTVTVTTPAYNGTNATIYSNSSNHNSTMKPNKNKSTPTNPPQDKSNVPIYIILLAVTIFAVGLSYVAYINWGTIKKAVCGKSAGRPKKKGYAKVKLASLRDAMP